jgi:hypothetical protein
MPTQYDVTNVLLDMGMDRANAEMAVPFMFMMPATTDPYSPTIIMIVATIQKRLAAKGYANKGRGFVDKATANALNQLAGRKWRNKTWLQLCGDVLNRIGSTPDRSKAMGMGADDGVLIWCSKEYPQGGCTPLSGVVKPMTVYTAEVFKDMQNQANRCASKLSLSPTAVDGRIGTGTLSLANKIVAKLKRDGSSSVYRTMAKQVTQHGISAAWPVSSIDELAAIADRVADTFKAVANTAGALTRVPGPQPAAPPSGSGGVLNPPDSQIVAGMPIHYRVMNSSMFLPGVGLAVVGVLYYMNKPKGKGKGLLGGIF